MGIFNMTELGRIPFKCYEINSKIVKQNINLIAGTFRSVIKSLARIFDSLRDYMDTTISKSTKCNAMNAWNKIHEIYEAKSAITLDLSTLQN